VVIKTKIKLTEDRPLKGARSFRSRSAGPKGPFFLFRPFRSNSFFGQGNLKMPSVSPSSSTMSGLGCVKMLPNVANGTARRCQL
jgi:hypothetical protein